MKKFALILVALVVTVFTNQAQLPSVQLKDINDRTVNASTLSNDGKPLLIFFHSTYCGPCSSGLKAIDEEYAEWQKQTGVKMAVVITVDIWQDPDYRQPNINFRGKNLKNNYDIFFDYNKKGEWLAEKLGITSIPYIVLLDGEGKIVYTKTGWSDSKSKEEKRELYNKIRSVARQ